MVRGQLVVGEYTTSDRIRANFMDGQSLPFHRKERDVFLSSKKYTLLLQNKFRGGI